MEMKSLFLGLFFSIGIFAVKSGMGLYFFFRTRADSEQSRKGKNAMVILSFSLVYLAVFCCSAGILKKMEIIAYYNTARLFLQSGMLIHFIMAAILVMWGLRTMTAGKKGGGYGWTALVFPCPVCVTVIFFISAFLQSFFSCSGIVVAVSAWSVFLVTSLITALVATAVPNSRFEPEVMLGGAMLAVAAYFTLSVVIMPQFADISKIYGLATYRGDNTMPEIGQLLGCFFFTVALFAAGVGIKRAEMVQKKGES